MVLTLRTDSPEAEIGLFEDGRQAQQESWLAHRRLAEMIHVKIENILDSHHKAWKDIDGIVVSQGPGSFTGLRIGITVAQALGYSLQIPVVGSRDPDWITQGLQALAANPLPDTVITPFYGALPNITKPRK